MLKYNFFLRNMTTQSFGLVAEWLCRGLQILGCRFDSDPGLQNKKIPPCGVFFCFIFEFYVFLNYNLCVLGYSQHGA